MDNEYYLSFLSRIGVRSDSPYPIENCKTMAKEELKETISKDLEDHKAEKFLK